ncbi:MAG: hypothetical protein CSA11_09045 [Chloroflexi bacterium]|nr:MAG: hypothetical protein CSB13_07715 [Chloroflexota bacterium]PIE80266.1 MAG: hypothetical protein CSA11_09045 [Chloroflexota bacterium]
MADNSVDGNIAIMQKIKLFAPCKYFLLIILWVGSQAACQTEPALPTLAAPAQVADYQVLVAETAVSPAISTAIPATFTPEFLEQAAANLSDLPTPLPSQIPSVVPTFATYTPRPTKTLTPTVTPEITNVPTRFPPQFSSQPPSGELGPSKLGVHVVRNNDPNILEFVRRAQPAVMKGVDDLGFLEEVKQVSPRTITIGRISARDQTYVGNPEETARDFVDYQLQQYHANPYVDYWEGWNEPDPNLDRMGWYARFEAERVRLLAQHGLKAAVGGFATGVPELDEFVLFLPAIEAAIAHGGILSLHEYGAPDMMFLYGDPLPGYPAYPDRGSLTFRYRWYYREILEPRDLVLPLVISEAGIDGIIGGRPGPAGTGWSDFSDYWVQQGLGNSGVEAFINQLNWYDNGVRQDGYVIGFTVFTAGAIAQWEEYDIDLILPDLADYVISQR